MSEPEIGFWPPWTLPFTECRSADEFAVVLPEGTMPHPASSAKSIVRKARAGEDPRSVVIMGSPSYARRLCSGYVRDGLRIDCLLSQGIE
jgi:hypothetical protein